MLTELYKLLPPEGVKILLVLFLAFLTGLEREERHAGKGEYSFGGVRTFPLIGLIAYGISFLAGGEILPVTLGFAVVAGFLMLSYRNKLQVAGTAGVTSEMSALTTYVAAALVYREEFWIATTLTVASMMLLELKGALEGLTKRIAPEEILTFTKFLLLFSHGCDCRTLSNIKFVEGGHDFIQDGLDIIGLLIPYILNLFS